MRCSKALKLALARGDRIELRGFGIFSVRPRKTGIGRNPRTGAEAVIPPGKVVPGRVGHAQRGAGTTTRVRRTNGKEGLTLRALCRPLFHGRRILLLNLSYRWSRRWGHQG